MDKASRVTIPAQLMTHAGIEREVVVAGVGNNLELWDKGRWEAEQQSLDEHIGELTESLGNPS